MAIVCKGVLGSSRSRAWRLVRLLAVVSTVGAGLLLALTLGLSRSMRLRAAPRIFESAADVGPCDVALVLGTAPTLAGGRSNPYLAYRLDAAASLWHEGRVRALILSGDNSRPDYDEPSAMRAGLLARGVPVEALVLDFAGFRTLDSVVRLRAVFGTSRAIIVSQRDHLERALYLASAKGIDATGLAARAPGATLRSRTREPLARWAAVLDIHVFRTEPRFYGPTVQLPTR